MASDLRIHSIVEESIVDGPGLRYVIFTQGCPHRCKGCHNPETHPFDGGYLIDPDTALRDFKKNPLLSGITFSGGEPFCQPAPLFIIGKQVKALGKSVMAYSGYTHSQLLTMGTEDHSILNLLSVTDILVDGPYIEAERDLALVFRGSRNQNVIYLNR